MFARVFDKAKRILSRSPSVQTGSSEVRDTPSTNDAPPAAVTMVTTRGGTETPGSAATLRSSARKRTAKRELESLDTPTKVKRQKKSATTPKKNAVQETSQPDDLTAEGPAHESGEEDLDSITVVVPSSDASTKAGHLPIRRRASPTVVVAKTSPPASAGTDHDPVSTQESGAYTPRKQAGIVNATPATPEALSTPKTKTARNRTPASVKRSSGRKKTLHTDEEPNTLEVTQTTSRLIDEVPSSTYETDHAPLSSQDVAAPSPQPKKEHRRFGSEEPTETRDTVLTNKQGHQSYEAPGSSQAADVPEADQADDDASDSDEAPEIVTTATATTKAKAAQAEADRALRAQQLDEQARRQKRAERIAEQQAEKRMREEKKAKKLAKQLAKQQKAAAPSDDEDEASSTRLGLLGNLKDLPAFLPDSLLETIDDQRPPTPPPERRGKTEEELRKEKLKHHIKFLERSDKPAKDVKKGKLSVAVLRQQNRVLPPKANRDTRNVRELWLKGRKVEKKKGGKPSFKKMERRALGGGGFLRGRDD